MTTTTWESNGDKHRLIDGVNGIITGWRRDRIACLKDWKKQRRAQR